MSPYSTDSSVPGYESEPENIDWLNSLTSKMGEAIKVNGQVYETGQSRDVLYSAGGMTIDYAFEHHQIPAPLIFELRDTVVVQQFIINNSV